MASQDRLELSQGAKSVLDLATEMADLKRHKAVDSSHVVYAALLNGTVEKFLDKIGVASSKHPVEFAWDHLARNGFAPFQDGKTANYLEVLNQADLSARQLGLIMVNSVHLFASALEVDKVMATEILEGATIDHTGLQKAADLFQTKLRIKQALIKAHDFSNSSSGDIQQQLSFALKVEGLIPSRRHPL